MANMSESIATKLSDLGNPKSGSYHPDGEPHPHTTKWLNRPWKDSGIWKCPLSFTFLVSGRKLMPDHPETPYCLGNLSDFNQRRRSYTTTSHMPGRHQSWKTCSMMVGLASLKQLWWAPVRLSCFMEDNPWEGLSLGEARDAVCTLSGATSWVGKQAQLNTNPLSLQEGQQLISLAIMEQCTVARGPECPHSHLPVTLPFTFHCRDEYPLEERFYSADELIEQPGHIHWPSHHDWDRAQQCSYSHSHQQWDLWVAQHPTQSLFLDHGLRVIGIQCQHLHWCHQGLIDWEAPGDHTMADATWNVEALWKLTFQSSRMRTQKM